MSQPKTKQKAPPKRPKPEAVETVPDAMTRFTEAMAKVVPPKRPKGSSRSLG